ncbi:MAG: sugar kinase, partial [Acidobacteria bacterium]|nr:sugar kinase [Acidobacteriota bacterium]
PRTHTSARYSIRLGTKTENHSSSGIIVSTGLGSTGWFRSVLTGATNIAVAVSGQSPPAAEPKPVPWDADHLFFSVREPWPSRTSEAGLTFGRITKSTPLVLTSQMPDHGVIFSDGMEADFLHFNSGMEATITVAKKEGRLVA